MCPDMQYLKPCCVKDRLSYLNHSLTVYCINKYCILYQCYTGKKCCTVEPLCCGLSVFDYNDSVKPKPILTLEVLVATIDAQWEGMGDVGSALLPPCPTIRFQKFSTLRVNQSSAIVVLNTDALLRPHFYQSNWLIKNENKPHSYDIAYGSWHMYFWYTHKFIYDDYIHMIHKMLSSNVWWEPGQEHLL